MTVNRKANPNVSAVLLKAFFSMAKFRSRYDDANSDVIKRTNATTPRTRLMSQKESGNCKSIPQQNDNKYPCFSHLLKTCFHP